MYEFIFKIDGDVYYRTVLESVQCKEIKSNGSRCKKHVIMGLPYCYVHSIYSHQLKYAKSQIANSGLGLYAQNPLKDEKEIIFKKGSVITKYFGEIIDEQEVIDRYSDRNAPYTVKLSSNRFEDASKYRGIGSLANTNPNLNNATIGVGRNGASLKATKNIRNGDEIYLSYGKSYKLKEPGVIAFTRKG